MQPQTDFVTVVRENVRAYGNQRSFTFVGDRKPGGAYQEHVLGFADLDRQARALACHLLALGLRDRAVLLLYPEGLSFVTAFLGCLYAGVVAVPSPLPALGAGRADRTRRIIDDAGITLILTDAARRDLIEEWLGRADLAGQVGCLATDTELDGDPDDWSAPPDPDPGALAFLQYTSGSTSDPKGVMVTHGNLLCNAEEIKRCIRGSSDTIGVGWIPHYHDMGLVGQFLQPLYLGCRYVFTSPITFLKRPVLWLELISRHRGTITLAPNFGYELCLRRVTDEQLAGLDLSSLRIAKNGAEPVRAGTLEKMVERFGPVGFRPDAWMPCYGMAEATLLVAAAPYGTGPVIGEFDTEALTRNEALAPAAIPGLEGRRLVSSGRPITLDVRIVDPETRAVLPDGRVGEIWVRGGSVATGYWRRPELTCAAFRAVTADGTGPYLRTGDLGLFADGELYVTGRIKDLIVVNGRNIYAHDIEETALSAHPAARVAAAFSVELGTGAGIGTEQVIVIQEISKARAAGTALSELAARTRDTVATAFGLPALSVVLSERGAVRRTTSGKIQRQLTRQDFLAGRIAELASDLEPGIAELRPASAGPVFATEREADIPVGR